MHLLVGLTPQTVNGCADSWKVLEARKLSWRRGQEFILVKYGEVMCMVYSLVNCYKEFWKVNNWIDILLVELNGKSC